MEEIEEWLLKDVVEKERGPVVYVSFSENVRKSCYDISARNLIKYNKKSQCIMLHRKK